MRGWAGAQVRNGLGTLEHPEAVLRAVLGAATATD
jgi:hypothetical protein